MKAADLLLAACLLSGPPAGVEPVPTEEHWPSLRQALRQVGMDRELLDEKETYFFDKRADFLGDLAIIRQRHADLHDAPPVADSFRLPPRSLASELCRFNMAFRKSLEERKEVELDRVDELSAVIREADQLYRVWDLIRDAECEWLYVPARRQALKNLRELIGRDAYNRGEFPPNIPHWRLEDRK
jgi:hypothetical protein